MAPVDIVDEDLSEWLNQENPVMCIWAFNYLSRRVRRDLEVKLEWSNYQACHYLLLSLSPREKELLLRKMKNAWGQVEYRERQKRLNRKYCSILLNEKALQQLREMALELDMPIRKALEQLIQRAYSASKKGKMNDKNQNSTPLSEPKRPFHSPKRPFSD